MSYPLENKDMHWEYFWLSFCLTPSNNKNCAYNFISLSSKYTTNFTVREKNIHLKGKGSLDFLLTSGWKGKKCLREKYNSISLLKPTFVKYQSNWNKRGLC